MGFVILFYVCLKFCKIKKKRKQKKSVENWKRRHFVSEWLFPCGHSFLPQNTSSVLIMITKNVIMWSNKLEKLIFKKTVRLQHLYHAKIQGESPRLRIYNVILKVLFHIHTVY